jgi:hypothetical protein
MLGAVFVRTLKPGVTSEHFKDTWVPEGVDGDYPVAASVSRNAANDRQVITILELDVSLGVRIDERVALTRPDALERLNDIVDTTELEGLYEEVFNATSL